MDEPFASLDAIVRARITEELLGWVERENLTVLLVTHDLEEAISLSDVVYVLSQGPRAGVRARHEVDIDRPRHVRQSRHHPLFMTLVQRLWDDLDNENAPPPQADPTSVATESGP
jgi:NitT/TauT family transport system ATP-binding protein